MPYLGKKQPNCIYGNCVKYVCTNKQCRKPGFICDKGFQTKSQCWLFHEDCNLVKWQEIQTSVKNNPLIKSPQFVNLKDKIENLFQKTLQKIQSQHQKFKIWTKTYGHNLQTMKFIKILMENNYEQLTGHFMSNMVSGLLNKDQKKMEIPMINENQLQILKSEIDEVIQKISTLYLRNRRSGKLPLFSESPPSKSPTTKRTSNHLQTFTVSLGSKSSNFLQDIPLNQNNHLRQNSTRENSENLIPLNQFKSKIIDSLSPIQGFFDGRVIKRANLIYRASEQNYSSKKFHQLCDNVTDTLTLIHNEFNKKFGGYTPVAWLTDKKHWVADKSLKSFIFSIDMNEKFNLNLTQFALASNPQKGPIFGCCDICVVDSSNKEKSNCEFPISYNNGKHLRGQNTSKQFTGHPKGQFLIKEWEVFKLQFE